MKEYTFNNKKVNTSDVNMYFLWKNVNVSSILILKYLDTYIINKQGEYPYCNKTKLLLPIHNLAYSYGLINTYIDESKSKIHLLFDREVSTSDLRLTTSNYYSFIDRLLDCELYHSIETKGDLLKVVLKVPKRMESDLELIMEGKYAETSDDFKERMRCLNTKVPISQHHPLGDYITVNAIPLGIVLKGEQMLKRIHKALDINIIPEQYYNKFSTEKDIWNDKFYQKYS